MEIKKKAKVFLDAYNNWSRDGGPLLAAAVAYWVALSLIPVLLMLIAGLGFFFGGSQIGQDSESHLLNAVSEQLSPQLSKQVQEIFAEVRKNASIGGPIGFVTLLITALGMFSQFDQAFDRIWNIEPKSDRGLWHSVFLSLRTRFTAFLMLLGLGALVVVVFLAGIVLSTLKEFADNILPYSDQAMWLFELVLTAALNTVTFALIYRLIPKRNVRWSHAFAGGLFAAIAWEIGRQALSHFVIGSRYSTAYGLLGTFMAVMVWAYYAVSVLFFGAEFIQAIRGEQSSAKLR